MSNPGQPPIGDDPFPRFDIPGDEARGGYFAKKAYVAEPLPTFVGVRDQLPNPIIESRPELAAMQWKCWELAYRN